MAHPREKPSHGNSHGDSHEVVTRSAHANYSPVCVRITARNVYICGRTVYRIGDGHELRIGEKNPPMCSSLACMATEVRSGDLKSFHCSPVFYTCCLDTLMPYCVDALLRHVGVVSLLLCRPRHTRLGEEL